MPEQRLFTIPLVHIWLTRWYFIASSMSCATIAFGPGHVRQGWQLILERCQEILGAEYPQLAESIRVMLPDEKTRRVGQSVAAASLPELQK